MVYMVVPLAVIVYPSHDSNGGVRGQGCPGGLSTRPNGDERTRYECGPSCPSRRSNTDASDLKRGAADRAGQSLLVKCTFAIGHQSQAVLVSMASRFAHRRRGALRPLRSIVRLYEIHGALKLRHACRAERVEDMSGR
jgi:hypothetical protein